MMAGQPGTSGPVPPKLFADKENNCGVAPLQNNGKLTKSGVTLRHAGTSDNVMVDQRPRSNLDGAAYPEHQMMEEDKMDSEIIGAANATELENSTAN